MNLNTGGTGRTTGQPVLESDCSRTPTEMCVPESDNNMASGVLCLAFQINALKQDDIFKSPALLFSTSGPGIGSAATLPHLVKSVFLKNEAMLFDISPCGPTEKTVMK